MGPVLITGVAGFIGYFTAVRFLNAGIRVIGVDNVNPYYDVQLKRDRLGMLARREKFRFEPIDICNKAALEALFSDENPTCVVHLAAQPGVRYSLQNPQAYIDSNIQVFLNVLEVCRHHPVQHLIFASSSSVYGANRSVPFSVKHSVDHPLSLYGATKKANELMAHAYSHLFSIPVTGLRFFTVYGPWGRPDMAPMLFARSILEGRPIEIFNEGRMRRDFTYVDDIVEGIFRVSGQPPRPNPEWERDGDLGGSSAPYRVYNIGNSQPVELLRFVEVLETALGRRASKIMKRMQPGDVEATYADIADLERDIGFRPHTPIEVGVARMCDWLKTYRSR